MKKGSLFNRVQRMLLRMAAVLPPTILIVSNIFLFGPFTIYQGNSSEFAVSFMTIIRYFFSPSLILVSILCAAGLLLPEKHHRRYVSVLFVVGILIWLQGNILVWEYGLIDGQGIDWTKNVWRGWVDGALWLVLLSLAFFFHKPLRKIALLASIVLVCLQAAYLGFTIFKQPEMWKRSVSKDYFPPEEIYQFSSKRNVIHIIFDGFQSDFFQEIIDDEIDYYCGALEGFTFFKETTGSFPTTYMSVTAILSGQNYKNDIPMPEFVKSILSGKTISNVLYDNGYEVDLVYPNIGAYYFRGRFSSAYNLPYPYGGTKDQYDRAKSALMMDLVLFRYAPHFLKKAVYNNQSWLLQRLVAQEKYLQFTPFSHKAFFTDLIVNMSVNRKKPVYKYIHLNTTHTPVVMNEDCEYAGKVLPRTKKNLKVQCKCALDHFIEFLEKLKSLNIYDNSLIILQADHGAGLDVKMGNTHKEINGYYIAGMVGSALPLMVIKSPHNKGPLRISKAQVMLTDTPATISSILNLDEEFPGRSVFEIDPNEDRERRYYHYKWRHELWQADFFPRLDEYIIKGSVFDRASWRFLRHLSAESSYQTQKIDFGTREASRFLYTGWSGNEMNPNEGLTYSWALGNSASIFLSLPKDEAVRLTANVKTLKFNKPQYVTVKIDNKEIATWEVSRNWVWGKHSIVIEPDEHRANVSVVEFIFSQHLDKQGKRPVAVLFESITLREPEDDK